MSEICTQMYDKFDHLINIYLYLKIIVLCKYIFIYHYIIYYTLSSYLINSAFGIASRVTQKTVTFSLILKNIAID